MLSFCALLVAVAIFMVRSQLRPMDSSSHEAGVMVALFTGASMLGGFVGARMTARVSNRVLGLVFAALLIIVAASTLVATLA